MTEIDLSGVGAGYIRVSEPTQDPRRQKTAIEGWLDRHSASIPTQHWYQDIGWARDKADTSPSASRSSASAQTT